jgi:hypothetical protein|tara:strand:- start:1479 stop:1709 length:231 start_codon:yes stop_codon:yes gene_type:complete
MIKFCKGCNDEIHPMRIKALPNTWTCVECSNVNMKRCVTVLKGDINKDDTWVDIELIDGDLEESYHTDIQDFENEE